MEIHIPASALTRERLVDQTIQTLSFIRDNRFQDMRLSLKKISLLGFTALVLSFVVFQVFSFYKSAQKMLADERARLMEQNRVVFEKRLLMPHPSKNV